MQLPFSHLPDMTSSIDSLVDDARQAYGEGRLEEALRLCEQLLEAAPERPEGHNIAGKVALDRSEFERALGLFEHAQALDPDHIFSAMNRALALFYLRRYDETEAALEHVLTIDGSARIHNKAREVLAAMRNPAFVRR